MNWKPIVRSMVVFVLAMVLLSLHLALAHQHDVDPERYVLFLFEKLNIDAFYVYRIPEELQPTVISLGFDPDILAHELAAAKWAESHGGSIDIGIMMAILENESSNGNNLGDYAASSRLSDNEFVVALELLEYWKYWRIRRWSLAAERQVVGLYSDYLSHAQGEMGANAFLPSSGYKACFEGGLSESLNPLIRSCNPFDYRSAAFMKAAWLIMIGYRSDLNEQQKLDSLWGWNHSKETRAAFLVRAEEINKVAEENEWGQIELERALVVESQGLLNHLLVGWLQLIEFLPKAEQVLASDVDQPSETSQSIPSSNNQPPPQISGGFTHPYPGSRICGFSYGSRFPTGNHWGIDLCNGGVSAPVYAMHEGVVRYAGYLDRHTQVAVDWWVSGYTVAVEGQLVTGETVWTVYGHGITDPDVQVGQQIPAGKRLFMSGSTGFSSGIHLHLGMKINGQWVNPVSYISGN